jgi:hypothetical protein
MPPDTQTQHIDEEYVDTLTGEIFEAVDNAKIVVEDLPKVCRALRTIRYKQQVISDYLESEKERLTAFCSVKSTPLTQQEERLMAIAESLLVASNERRLAYPGLGVVRFVAGRESVDATRWDALDERAQIEMSTVNQGAFRVKTVIEPDKKEIAKRLRDGSTTTAPLTDAFEIKVAPDKFDFKAFVDEFVGAGMIPISLIRWEMTGLDDEMKKIWPGKPTPATTK